MKQFLYFAFFLLLLLSSCAPQPPIALPTNTPAQQNTPVPLPTTGATQTPPPTFTPTPDLRVINLPAQNFKLTLGDLPKGYVIRFVRLCQAHEPECAFPSDRIEGPHLNIEVMQKIGMENGSQYINDTARIEGWYVYYYNDAGDKSNPTMVMSSVERFTTAAGARKRIESYSDIDLDLGDYVETRDYALGGDYARVYVRSHNGAKYVLYQFSYHNIAHRILISGTDTTITADFVHDLVRKALAKLYAAELSSSPRFPSLPTFTPQPNAPSPDQRVIDADPLSFILETDDLPPAGSYYRSIEKDSLARQSNLEIARKYQGGIGGEYVRETGRLDGWSVRYNCGTQDALLPPQISNSVIMFQSAEGAQKHVTDYVSYFLREGWIEVAPQNIVGDSTRIFIRQDDAYQEYLFSFSHHNYVHELRAYGLQAEIDPAFMEMVAFNLLLKLQSAPLSSALAN